MTTEHRPGRGRKPHPAGGARFLVAGLSASLLVGLVGAMTRADTSTSVTGNPATASVDVQVAPATTPPVTQSRAT